MSLPSPLSLDDVVRLAGERRDEIEAARSRVLARLEASAAEANAMRAMAQADLQAMTRMIEGDAQSRA